MPAKDLTRWSQNPDGSWSRVHKKSATTADSYMDMTKPELQAELEAKGLPTSGTKAELVERLEAA